MRCSIALFAVLLGGCATEIVPPPAPETPVRVGVLDHGRHASLVVELLADGVVRYAYGDWDWYALGRTGPAEAVAALFWPTRGALGRRRLPGPAEPESIGAQVPEIVEDSVWFDADAAAASALVARLDGIFAANLDTRVYNETYGLEFVHDPERYSMFHNSNRRVADWIVALGARVNGPALLSVWTLRTPPDRPAQPTPAQPRPSELRAPGGRSG